MWYNKPNGGALVNAMAQTLEQYVAEATNAYKPAQTAIQNQLGALDSQYNTGMAKINRDYAQQQAQLESQRNQAAEASSMAAAGSGGSFGGQGNLARRKYYEQSFVPAQTQLQTNQTNSIEALKQNIDNQRTSLNSQLANLEAQANQQALQQYWSALEAEKQRAAQRAAAAAQNSYYDRIMNAMKNSGNGQNVDRSNVGFLDWVNKYSNLDSNTKNSLTNALGSLYNQNGAVISNLQNAMTKRIQNSAPYKQYLSWKGGA